MDFLQRITTEELASGLAALRRESPEIEALYYIMGDPKILEWAHTVGVATEPKLRAAAPPVPPIELRSIVAAPDEAIFLWTGLFDARFFVELYEKSATPTAGTARGLDFGCGCGRMTRFIGEAADLQLHGTDVNDRLVRWCGQNLPRTATAKNSVLPPLRYDGATFDFIYSVSIFTHLPERNAAAWLAELARVTRPGGTVILTTHGPRALETISRSTVHQQMFHLSSSEALAIRDNLSHKRFEYLRYETSTLDQADAGSDYGNSFTHADYIGDEWLKAGFDLVEHLPGGLRGWQDITVLRRT